MDTAVLLSFNVFLLVFSRMSGMVFINPIFARRNVPMMVRVGLVLSLSLFLLPAAGSGAAGAAEFSGLVMMGAMIREITVGLVIGCIFPLFFNMLYVAGDMVDTAFGLAMGKVMDPVNGVQTAVLGQFINIFFYLYFFATGSHLVMVRIFAYTYEVIPVGASTVVSQEILSYIIALFGLVFQMVIRLTLPFVAAEFILEVTMGVLMKLIPQIHVFVINIQSKILLGILLMVLFAYPMGAFIDSYIAMMMGEVQKVMMMFS